MGYVPSTQAVADGSITAAKLASSAVTLAKVDYTSLKGLQFISKNTFTTQTGTDFARFTGISSTTYTRIVFFYRYTASADGQVVLRLNQDATASDYVTQRVSGTTNQLQTNAFFEIGYAAANTIASGIASVTLAGAQNILTQSGAGNASDTTRYFFGSGTKKTGVTVTSLDFSTAGAETVTGFIECYGVPV